MKFYIKKCVCLAGFIFIGASCSLAISDGVKDVKSSSELDPQVLLNAPVDYKIEEGNQYALCRDLVPYLKKRDEMGGGGKKSNFIVVDPKISVPKWKEEKPFLGLKITMQSYAYSPASFEGRTGWEKRISNLKGQMTKDFTVKTAEMDLNNDGTVDRVVEVSSFDERINRRIYINYPLSEFNNLAVDWFSKERPLAVLGELFLYENRTFVLSVHHFEKSKHKYIWQYLVGEPNPSPMRDSGGLIVSPSICNIVVLSNN